MSRPERSLGGPLARRDGEPAFDEPWQAQVLALANALMANGTFDNTRWSATLGAALAEAAARGEPDTAATYYHCALAALSTLLEGAGLVSDAALGARSEAWRQAYLDTPHGSPVELPGALVADGARAAH